MNNGLDNDPNIMPPQAEQGRKTWVILLIVVLMLCCLCILALGFAWQFGDQILQILGISL